MPGSILVAVRSTLIDQLAPVLKLEFTNDPDLRGVDAAYQWKPDWQQRVKVWTRNARFQHDSAGMRAGRNYRNEVGTFELVALIEGVGRPADWTAGKAMDVGTICEEFIADHKNNELAVPGLQTLEIQGAGGLLEAFADSGTLAELTYPIRYTARLT